MKRLAFLLGFVGMTVLVVSLWIPAKAIAAQLLIAEAWEESLATGSIVKPWPWIDTWPVARLRVPAHEVSLIALNGLSGQALAFGPGLQWSDESLVPRGAVMIAAHNDTHFTFLEDLAPGDQVQLELPSGVLGYSVSSSRILDVREGPLVLEQQGQLVFVTCYPFELDAVNGPLRYVVSAVQVPAAL